MQKSNGIEVYYTRERIERFVVALIILIILILLIVPVYLLYRLTEGAGIQRYDAACIGILVVSTLLFSLCISMSTSKSSSKIPTTDINVIA